MLKLSSILSHYGKPATVAAALAIGFFANSGVEAQVPSQEAPQLQRLLNEQDHRFSEAPLLRDRVRQGQPLEAKPFVPGNSTPAESFRPEKPPQALLGSNAYTNANQDPSRARVVMPQGTQIPQAEATGSIQTTMPVSTGSTRGMVSMPNEKVYQLRNVSMSDFEQKVVSAYGNQLRASTSSDGRFVRVAIPGSQSSSLTTLVDRKSGQLTYEGEPQFTAEWTRMMRTFDGRPATPTVAQVGFPGLASSVRTMREVGNLMNPQDPELPQIPGATPPQDGATQGGQDDDTNKQEVQLPGLRGKVELIRGEDGNWIVVGDFPEDVEKVQKLLGQWAQERQGTINPPGRIDLKNVRGSEIEERVQEIYDSNYQSVLGEATILGDDNPNQLLVVGSDRAIAIVKQLAETLDRPTDMDPGEGFKTFILRYISAADAERRLENFFAQTGLTTGDNALPSDPTTVIADFRSNQITVRGPQQLILTAKAFLDTIDVDSTKEGPVNVVRVVKLKNSVADNMAFVIQNAITGSLANANIVQASNATQGQGQQQQQQQGGQAQQGGQQDAQSTLRSPQLILKTIGGDTDGGIMFDVRITPDSNSNSLIVQGPAKAMELVLKLIEQLDVIPDAETQLKVFELVHGDAQTVLGMLETLFGAGQQQGGGQGGQTSLSQLPLQGASATDGNTIVNVRFSYEPRSNAIIASGPAGDLQVIEDLLNRLDAKALTHVSARVYRLSNAPALDVATAINAYLDAQNDLISSDPRTNQGVPAINRAVIVQHDVVSNSLIVKALPEYRKEIEDIIRALDRRPPMVKVKTLIAEVDLTALEEFGVELGIQDSLLFDRGTTVAASGALTGVGFPFTGATGAVPNANAFARELVAGRAVTAIGVDSSGGGLVLSAGNESISVLMRALKNRSCLRVLSKPHITTLENLQGRVAIGANVARPAGVTTTGLNATQSVDFQDVGVIVEVTPRVSPDGMIILSVNAEKSSVGPAETGTVIGFDNNNNAITAPQILKAEATTTLMARSGQTVVFSGLIDETKSHTERGVPVLSDLPVLGPLFKFESDSSERSELLIIMTPFLINDDQDLERMNQDEMDRMHWCLSDVAEIYGNTDYSPFAESDAIQTVYPDLDPSGTIPTSRLLPGAAETRVQDSRLQSPSQPRFSQENRSAAETSQVETQVKTADRKARRGLFSRRR